MVLQLQNDYIYIIKVLNYRKVFRNYRLIEFLISAVPLVRYVQKTPNL